MKNLKKKNLSFPLQPNTEIKFYKMERTNIPLFFQQPKT